MHICMVAFTDLRFDARIFREASALQDSGQQVTIVATSFAGTEVLPLWQRFDTHLLPINRERSLRLLYPSFWRQAYKILREVTADVYHAHDLDTLWPAARAASHFGVPLVYDSHELWTEQSSIINRPLIRWFWTWLEKHLTKKVAYCITVSDGIKSLLEELYPLHNVTIVRNLPQFRTPIVSNRIREELGLEQTRPIVLYQGGFLTENGLLEQIDAAASFETAALVLIGGGPCETQLRDRVSQKRLQETVFFLPRVSFDELHEYTCSADIGLCLIKNSGLSFYHSMPNKLFEYFMAGIPVIASDFPEIGRVVRDTGAGLLANPQDSKEVALQVNQLASDDRGMAARANAARKAAQTYNWECEAQKLTSLYAGL